MLNMFVFLAYHSVSTRGRFNIKMLYNHYGASHSEDKAILMLSNRHNAITYISKTHLDIETGPWFMWCVCWFQLSWWLVLGWRPATWPTHGVYYWNVSVYGQPTWYPWPLAAQVPCCSTQQTSRPTSIGNIGLCSQFIGVVCVSFVSKSLLPW